MAKDIQVEFFKALKKLQDKFPMVYVETWTPSDFNVNNAGDEVGDTDWNDPKWSSVAFRLRRNFDAEIGTNWDTVAAAAELTD